MISHTAPETATETASALPAGLRRFALPVFASLVVALAAHIAFPLPFTPIPFTLQPLAVLGVGLALGPWQAAIALCLYLLEGALGAPVFSPIGPGGLAQLLGASGGFLLAYPAVALICSGLTRYFAGRLSCFTAALLGCTLATLCLFAAGSAWLAVEAHLTMRQAMFAAVLPFLPGEAVKILAAAGTFRALGPPSSTLRTR